MARREEGCAQRWAGVGRARGAGDGADGGGGQGWGVCHGAGVGCMNELLSIPHPNPSPEGEGLRFAGYAAVFDRVDRGGDVVLRGAFAGSGGQAVPLLWQHAPDKQVGVIERSEEHTSELQSLMRITYAVFGL